MRRVATLASLVALSLLAGALPTRAQAQGYPTMGDPMPDATRASLAESARRFNELAPKLVQSAGIKPGDLVTISGGLLMVRQMEALGAEVQKAGGRALLFLDSPRLTRELYASVPEDVIAKSPTSYEKFAAQNVAVAFYLPSGEDFASVRTVDRRSQVDQELAKLDAASRPERDKGITRSLFIGIPTPSDTASIQMDYPAYAEHDVDRRGCRLLRHPGQGRGDQADTSGRQAPPSHLTGRNRFHGRSGEAPGRRRRGPGSSPAPRAMKRNARPGSLAGRYGLLRSRPARMANSAQRKINAASR